MDAELDFLTGDYTGARIAHLGNAVRLRLLTPLGSWWADPELGSRLHLLLREKDTAALRRRAEQYALQALQPLLEDGRVASLDVSASAPHDGRCLLRITVQDARGRTQTFSHAVKVA